MPPISITTTQLKLRDNQKETQKAKTNIDYSYQSLFISSKTLQKSSSTKSLLTPTKQFNHYPLLHYKQMNNTTNKKIGVSIGSKLKQLNLILTKPRKSVPKIINSPCLLMNELEKDTKSNFNNKYNFLIKKENTRNPLYPAFDSFSTNIIFGNSIVKTLFPNKNNLMMYNYNYQQQLNLQQQNENSKDESNGVYRVLFTKKKFTVNLLLNSK